MEDIIPGNTIYIVRVTSTKRRDLYVQTCHAQTGKRIQHDQKNVNIIIARVTVIWKNTGTSHWLNPAVFVLKWLLYQISIQHMWNWGMCWEGSEPKFKYLAISNVSTTHCTLGKRDQYNKSTAYAFFDLRRNVFRQNWKSNSLQCQLCHVC